MSAAHPANEELKAAARRVRLEAAGRELARTVLELDPGEVLEVKRNPDDAPALITVARYSVLDADPGPRRIPPPA